MRDNKVRLSADVLEKATLIATEWGLKNPRAAVEAVFRRYADDYLFGRTPTDESSHSAKRTDSGTNTQSTPSWNSMGSMEFAGVGTSCEALDALDDLLGA